MVGLNWLQRDNLHGEKVKKSMIELRKVQEKDRDLLWNINQKEVLLISIPYKETVFAGR